MNQRIRRLGIGLMVLYVMLFAQLNRVQFYGAEEIVENPNNSRPLLRAFGEERGEIITADGMVTARSVPTGNPDIEFRREYPTGERYAHIVGYQSFNQGATGLERQYNDELAGTEASQQFTGFSDLFTDRDVTGDVHLTLRNDVQQVAIDQLGQRKGSVVAIEPSTGAVLAMWTYPSFDPNPLSSLDGAAVNEYYSSLLDDPNDPLLAKAYRELFFPGSTFKVITAAAGLDSGRITATSPVFGASAAYDPIPAGAPLRNFGGQTCGGDLFEILRVSCNAAFAEMGAEWLGPAEMIAGAEQFGFNDTPPIDLPDAAASNYPVDYGAYIADVSFYRGEGLPNGDVPVHENSAVLAQTAIGQNDVKATPLQMALMTAAIANEGVMMAPHVVDRITDAEGAVYEEIDNSTWRVATSEVSAATLSDAMVGVVEGGTASNLAIAGMRVGGKTGTAQLGTDPPNSHAWIVGFAGPPGQPAEVAVAVIVEAQEGASEQTGGRVAAPIARAVMEQVLSQ